MSVVTLPAMLPFVPSAAPVLTATRGGVTIIIGGSIVTPQHGSVTISNAVGQRSTGSFIVLDLTNSLRFRQGMSVTILDSFGNRAFTGVVTDDQRKRSVKAGTVEHTVQVADWHYLADKRLAPYSNSNVTCGGIVSDLISQFLAAEGVTAGVIQAGPTVVTFVSAYGTVAECLDALVQKAGTGWYWQIDANKQLQFQQQTAAPLAPFIADESLMEMDSIVPTHGNPQYRNKQFMLGGVAQTSTQTETRQGDGKTTAFTMSYPMAQTPTVTLNGAAQTVGSKTANSGSQWYWAPGDPVLAQDNAGTKLLSTDTLQVVYVGQFPNVAVSQDSTAVAAQQSREGGGTGLVEAAAIDTTLTSINQAFQSASGYLSKYAHDRDSIQFLTTESGLASGQLLTVNVPPDDFVNEQMLIESVDLTDVGPNSAELGTLWYLVKAVSGPLNTGWVQFFKSMASQQNVLIGSISVGQSQTLTLLQAVTETWPAWTESVTETIYACPVPAATLYPSATLYPC